MSEKNGKAEWTIMVYISADEVLANFAIESLRRLKRKANDRVIVAAQFGFDSGNGSQEIRRYIFNREDPIPESIAKNLVAGDIPKNLSAEELLANFVNFVVDPKEYEAKHYALILWGHGPELLFQTPSSNGTDGKRLYLTPVQLRVALEGTKFNKDGKKYKGNLDKRSLDIIGFDACSLSMIEMAYELKDLAKFMVASQGDVPDLSFPYDSLISLFSDKKHKFNVANKNTDEFLQESVRRYALAYEDYISSPGTNMENTTLSCLQLEKADEDKNKTSIVNGVRDLAGALFESRREPALPDILISARKESIGFAGGLWVDLFTFCEELLLRLKDSAKVSKTHFVKLQDACQKILDTLTVGHSDSCVIANAAVDPRCHGVSIYFPYLTEADVQAMRQPLAKTSNGGDTGGIKGLTGALNQIATTARFDVRQRLIEDTEDYYPELKFAQTTGWYDFISNQWSRILAENETDLDFRYSAQQCAENLLRNVIKLESQIEKCKKRKK